MGRMRRVTIAWAVLLLVGLLGACRPTPARPTFATAAITSTTTAAGAAIQPATLLSTQPATDAPPTSTLAPTGVRSTSTLAAEVDAAPRVRPLLAAINVRGGPGTSFETIATLRREETAAVLGRDQSGDWYLVVTDSGLSGWVAANLVELVAGDAAGIALAATIPAPPTAPPGVSASPVPTIPTAPPADDQPPVARPSRTPTPNPAPSPTSAPPPTDESPPTVNPYP